MNLPLTYDEKEKYTPEDHYMFISYSHKDKDIVYHDLDILNERGVKFWYDKGLECGSEKWYTQVKQRITDRRCVGVIFYLSPYVFTSESIEKEIEYITGRNGQKKSYFSVNIGGGNTTDLQDRTAILPLEEKVKRNTRRTGLITKTFDDALIFIPRSEELNDESHIDAMIHQLLKYNIVEGQQNGKEDFVGYEFLNYNVTSEGNRYVEFGEYPQKEVKMFSIWEKDLKELPNDCFSRYDVKYKYFDGQYFLFEPIRWKILSLKNKVLYLISDKCIDCRVYHESKENVYWEDSDIRKWLNNDFYEIAFCDEDKKIMTNIDNDKVSMLTLEELQDENLGFTNDIEVSPTREAMPTDYAMALGGYSGPTGTCYWWYKMPFGNASISPFVYDNGGINNFKGAFRVTIKIDLNKVPES